MADPTDFEHQLALVRRFAQQDPERAQLAYERAEAVAATPLQRARLRASGALLLAATGDLDAAEARAAGALDVLADAAPSASAADAWLLLGSIRRRRSELDGALQAADRAVVLGQALADALILASAHNNAGLVHALADRIPQAIQRFTAALDAAGRTPDDGRLRGLVAAIRAHLGNLHLHLDEPERALHFALAASDGLPPEAEEMFGSFVHGVAARALASQGRHDEAAARLARGTSTSHPYHRLLQASRKLTRARMLREQGSHEAARLLLSGTVADLRNGSERTERWCAQLELAALAGGEGRWADGIAHAAEVFAEAERCGASRFARRAADQLTALHEGAGDLAAALAAERRARALERTLHGALVGQARGELERSLDVADARAAARLEAAAAGRAREGFLAHASHQLRTPLNAILGYTEMLLEDVEEPGARDDLERIRAAAAQQLVTVDTLLKLTSVDAGDLRARPRQVDLRAALHALHAEWVEPLARSGRTLLVDLPTPLPCITDDQLLVGALRALLGDATPRPRVSTVLLRAEIDDASVRVQVCDDGERLSPHAVAAITDGLGLGDVVVSRRDAGIELGPALAARYARLLGGTMRAYHTGCRGGPGATFVIDIPRIG